MLIIVGERRLCLWWWRWVIVDVLNEMIDVNVLDMLITMVKRVVVMSMIVLVGW